MHLLAQRGWLHWVLPEPLLQVVAIHLPLFGGKSPHPEGWVPFVKKAV